MPKRILLISPATDLPKARAEVQAIVNTMGLEVTLVQDQVTIENVTGLNWTGDTIYFAGHGTNDGLVVDDGLLSIDLLAPFVRRTRAKLLFINSCSSEYLAEQLNVECGIQVICTVQDIPDLLAFTTGRNFIRELADTEDYRAAYERSKPGRNRHFRYIGGTSEAEMKQPDVRNDTTLEAKVEALVRAIAGDAFSGTPGLISSLDSLRKELHDYHNSTEAWKRQQEAWMRDHELWRRQIEAQSTTNEMHITPSTAAKLTSIVIFALSTTVLLILWASGAIIQ